jgi:RimJ/RimL family protein N-acetyltransferase
MTLEPANIPYQGRAIGVVDTPNLHLEWEEVSWDSLLFGYPVLQIRRIELRGMAASNDMATFEAARDKLEARIVSSRMSHDRLRESMLLEAHGFRFIEMVYQPQIEDLQAWNLSSPTRLNVAPALRSQIRELQDIASYAFRDGHGRFHVDPRINSELGDKRYCNWVATSFDHSSQRLYTVRDGQQLVAFFITEILTDGTCYWHLNAVAPYAQGRGYGWLAWVSMLYEAKSSGALRVRTCIGARNHRAMNLYSRLGFRFPPPQMTFHWVRETPLD